MLTASSISSLRIVSVRGLISSGTAGMYSHLSAVTSFVMSTSTGPGRPLFAMRKALRTTFAS